MDFSAFNHWLATEVAPQAAELDRSSAALRAVLQQMGDRSWLGLSVPACYGGSALTKIEVWQAQAAIASTSGALAFLQTQHQSAAAFLAKHDQGDRDLKGLALGQPSVGIGFSHLRRSRSPLQAQWQGDQIQLEGSLPWLTGWGFFDAFLIAAPLPEGEIVFCLIPATAPEWQVTPLDLAAMASTGTVSAELTISLPADQVIATLPSTWIRDRDRQSVLSPTAFAVGITRAALRQLKNSQPAIAASFFDQLQALEQLILKALEANTHDSEEAIALRLQALQLMHQSVQAAVFAAAGAANSLQHPAQRLYRDALAFSVLGLTPDLRDRYLAAIRL